MILLIMMVVTIIFMTILEAKMLSKPNDENVEIVEVEKNCPPHKWGYVEVKNKEGETIRWKIVCAICGPLERME